MPLCSLGRRSIAHRSSYALQDETVDTRLRQFGLTKHEGFGVAFGRAAFHPAQARQSAEDLRVEPVLRALRSEMSEEKLDFAIHHTCLKRHIDIRLADITVPLGNFVFKDQVIAERIRCEAVELAVILMCVGPTMGEYDIGVGPGSKIRHPLLDEITLIGKEAVPELCELDFDGGCTGQECGRGGLRLAS